MHTIEGKRVECKFSTPKESKTKKLKKSDSKIAAKGKSENSRASRKVFVGGLPKNTSEDDLNLYFSQFGELEDYVVMIDRDSQKPRGFGFVTFKTQDAVKEVL